MFTESGIGQRIFIVGCPRSGTTLLQAMMGMHPTIQTFPETHFFDYAFPSNFLKRRLTWPALNVSRVMKRFMLELGRPDLAREALINPFSADYARKFVELLDRITCEEGKKIWVEKTPKHLHFIEEISREVPRSKFIHIVRSGAEVVASLYEITNRDPKAWTRGRRPGFKGFTVDECITLWNHDIQITERYRDCPGHHVVRYEALISDPEETLRDITAFLEVEFSAAMLKPEKLFDKIVGSGEPWKATNARPLHHPRSKFEEIFSEEMQRYILDNLIALPF